MKSHFESDSADYKISLQEALKRCADEPIHRIGSIQPNGVLIAVNPHDWTIKAVSANLGQLLPIAAGEALNQPLDKLLGPEAVRQINLLSSNCGCANTSIGSIRLAGTKQQNFDIQVFSTPEEVVIEFELQTPAVDDVFHKLFVPIRDALWRLDAEQDMLLYANAVVGQVRLLTGFDRVMMYRFDDNWDGEVIAESKVDDVVSYLGNRFPASDIPPQARQLYTLNLVRMLADIQAPQIPLLMDDSRRQPVDLSFSWLRSMSPVHVEYLQNMGIRASLSISLVQDNALWGLIACHHFTPKYVTIRERELNELIGRTVSLKLHYMDNAKRYAMNNRVRYLLYRFTEKIQHEEGIQHAISEFHEELLDLAGASGVLVTIGGIHHRFGELPPQAAVEKLLDLLRKLPPASIFRTECLAEFCSDMEQYRDVASGIMAVPIDHLMQDFVMWFRPALLRTLRWAGSPEKVLLKNADGLHISPRRSFETWIETYHDKCAPWMHVEIDAVNAMSLAIIKLLTQHALRSQEKSYRLLAEHSTDMIASLDAEWRFNYASPASADLLGVLPVDLLGRKFEEFVVLNDRIALFRAQEELRLLNSQTTLLIRNQHAKGKQIWLEVGMKRIQSISGSDEIVINARDVTQRYTYQLAIEDLHKRNTRILDAASDGLISLDRNGKVIYANEVALEWFGVDASRFINNPLCNFIYSADRNDKDSACRKQAFMNTLSDGETRQGNVIVHSLAHRLPVSSDYLCTPLKDENTITGCVIVFNQNISKNSGDKDQQTQVILEQTAEAVMVTNSAGRILSVNRAFSEITGYSAEEAIGQTPRLIRSGVHTPNFYEEFWRTLAEQCSWKGEIWNKRKNGEIYPQWGSVTAMLDDEGKVKNYVAVFSDISKAKQAENKLEYMASHDTLTGLPNRAAFSDQLGRSIDWARRNSSSIAVVFVDLDHFKAINDTLGHSVGDTYLKRIAERLVSVTRKDDTLARWGGDEFVLAFKDIASKMQVAETLQRLLQRLAEPLVLDGQELIPQASLGVSIYPEDGGSNDDLIKAADTAMYRAKHRGRNCYEFYTQDMKDELEQKFSLTIEMRRALVEEEFCLYFQPQVHARHGRVIGVEALLRWQHPSRGLVGPDQFVPLAEEIGLICDIGDWVLNEGCRHLRSWIDHEIPLSRLAINVSPQQLKPSFVEKVANCLKDWHLDPSCLELEITEGMLVGNSITQTLLQELRDIGVLLSVDDFGTGYSSLSHIRNFPITCFKIDKSFVMGLPHEQQDLAIVQTIVALGSNMKVEIVAEGVETLSQVECLRAAGVDHLQGYFCGPPMSADRLLEFIAKLQGQTLREMTA
jgi:diguanylate cyclase (GGDEF)-like protein/PAS domain S-box-containing protein